MSTVDESDALIDNLLACLPAERYVWLTTHREDVGMATIEALKRRTDSQKQTNPPAAGAASALALWLAEHLPDEPFAYPLACWARGNWALLHEPREALARYRQALVVYAEAGATQETVRLLSNLIGAAMQCGELAEGFAAYERIEPLLPHLPAEDEGYLATLYQNYGLLLHEAGEYEDALTAHRLVHQLGVKHALPEKIWEADVNYALALYELGRFDEAENILLHCRQLVAPYEHWITIARIEMDLGDLYTAQGRPAKALHALQSARSQFARIDNPMELGSVALREAMLFERIGALDASRRAYAAALTTFTDRAMWPQVGRALVQGSVANRRYGDFPRSAQLLAQATKLWKELGQPVWLARVVLEEAVLALAQHKPDLAEQALSGLPTFSRAENPGLAARYALVRGMVAAQHWQRSADDSSQEVARRAFLETADYAREQNEFALLRQALVGLGRLERTTNPAQAQSWLKEAAGLDEEMRRSLSVEELKAGFLTQTNDIYPLLIEMAVEGKEFRQALDLAWRAKGGALFDLLQERRWDGQDEKLKTQIEESRRHLTQARLAAISSQEDVFAVNDNHNVRQRERELSDLRRQRNRAADGTGPIVSLSNAGNLPLAGADMLLEYARSEDGIVGIVAGSDGVVRAVQLASVASLRALGEELTLAFEYVLSLDDHQRLTQMAGLMEECRPLLGHLYDLLIRPLLGTQRPQRLLIAPCDPLYSLPFAAFWDGATYLVERCALEFTPTAALLCQEPGASQSQHPLLVVGSTQRGRLPAVLEEAATIQRLFPDSVSWIDQPETSARLGRLTDAPHILHIATHAVTRHDAPIFSELHLAEDILTVEQCYELPLDGTALVVLNACSTAAGMGSGGALLAFQSAFFAAGTERVISTLWPIGDRNAAAWMDDFYSALAAGNPPAAALDNVQRAWIREAERAHPALWAAFVCSRC
ncbi:MAG: CHAT domain-containing protein [Chloroflexi bacterium]|nr:MAG: CHAT domain-containing protein [Chloroflexota bacterium]